MARTGNPKAVATVLALAVVLAVAVATLLATPPPADAASRFKVVKKTFSNSQPVAIPESGASAPYPSEKSVGGFKKGKIVDANLTLKNLSHADPYEVDVMLSHRGVNRTVMSDAGSLYTVFNITLALDDEAASNLPSDSGLTAGTFRSTNYPPADDGFPAPAPAASGAAELSGFDGMNPNGPWRLWVYNDSPGNGGAQFAGGWSITIKAKVRR